MGFSLYINVPYGEVPPKRGTFVCLQDYDSADSAGISQFEAYETDRNSTL